MKNICLHLHKVQYITKRKGYREEKHEILSFITGLLLQTSDRDHGEPVEENQLPRADAPSENNVENVQTKAGPMRRSVRLMNPEGSKTSKGVYPPGILEIKENLTNMFIEPK